MAAPLLLMFVSSVRADDLFRNAPPVPPGYSDFRAAQAAVLFGKVAVINVSPEVPDEISVHKDITYATPEGNPLGLDLFVPKDTKAPPPVVLFIHGGGWKKGRKEDYAFYNIEFAKLGYATASVQYRLSPANHFPAAIQDVKSAVVWLQMHGEKYGFDGSRMVLVGGSAGGHLALLAGYSQDPALECPSQPEGLPNPVRGVVNFYGVVDCTTPRAQHSSEVRDFIGKPYGEAPEVYAQSSPIHHLDKGDPPTLTFHGTIDELVPIAQADKLHGRLTELGIPNYLDRIEGWPHTMDLARPINDRCRHVIAQFLEKHLPREGKRTGRD